MMVPLNVRGVPIMETQFGDVVQAVSVTFNTNTGHGCKNLLN
ncbi:hypothetical protein SDC9_156940 [bioreactor metagenome]|uniref:Uncharacterized protein n=1 Tax=bioreactor metagenome TaxID=1076179 RepID=A0A645F8I9_9ZZZZ